MTIIQGIQQRPLHHDYKQTKTLPVITIRQFSNQCDRCKMLKVVHGNQSDNHCKWSDIQLSIPLLYILYSTTAVLANAQSSPFLV